MTSSSDYSEPPQEMQALRAEIERGEADIAEGRVRDFDTSRIVERGGVLPAKRGGFV